jgi:hypothetical protein
MTLLTLRSGRKTLRFTVENRCDFDVYYWELERRDDHLQFSRTFFRSLQAALDDAGLEFDDLPLWFKEG